MRIAKLFGQVIATLLLIGVIGAPSVHAQITVSLPALEGIIGDIVSVPVELANVENTGPFSSFEFRVVTSTPAIVFTGKDATNTHTGDPDWFVGSSTTTGRVGGYVRTDSAVTTSGTLIMLLFRLDGLATGATVELQDFRMDLEFTRVPTTPSLPSTEFNISTDAEDETTLPEDFRLRGNYPNPFNPTTNIQFDLPQTSEIEISIMDILGREMLTIPSQTISAGAGQTVAINAKSLASGIYIYRVIARSANELNVASGTMTLIK